VALEQAGAQGRRAALSGPSKNLRGIEIKDKKEKGPRYE
jgi:hypothetical protein